MTGDCFKIIRNNDEYELHGKLDEYELHGKLDEYTACTTRAGDVRKWQSLDTLMKHVDKYYEGIIFIELPFEKTIYKE